MHFRIQSSLKLCFFFINIFYITFNIQLIKYILLFKITLIYHGKLRIIQKLMKEQNDIPIVNIKNVTSISFYAISNG